MLHSYPETLLDFAVGGVVHASCLSRACDAERVLTFARKQSQAERDGARQESNALRAAATADGYCDGMRQALALLLPLFAALTGDQAVLRQTLATRMQQALSAIGNLPSVAVPQVQAACAEGLQGRESVVLHVPRTEQALYQALQAQADLQGLDIRQADRQHLLLEVGDLAFVLDASSALGDGLQATLTEEMNRLQRAINRLGDTYRERLQRDFDRAAQVAGLQQTKENR